MNCKNISRNLCLAVVKKGPAAVKSDEESNILASHGISNKRKSYKQHQQEQMQLQSVKRQHQVITK